MIDNNLKYCREELEMTQSELGKIFGVSKSTVSGWENGHDTMPLEKLVKFSNLYNYSLDFILGLTNNKSKYNKEINIDKNKIGDNLKQLRNELGLTQQVIATECKISQSSYSDYETGNYLINTTSFYSICRKYNISADWLVGRSNVKKIK